MGIASDLKNLGEDIVTSYASRVKAIGTLVKDTHQMLKGFDAEHKEMAINLRAGLAKGEKERLKDFKSMMADIQKAIKEIEAYTANKLKEFNTAHAEMAANLRAGLAKGETERLKDFKSMMADIQKRIKEIETYVKNKLKEFSADHAEMSVELKKELAKYVDDMVKATKKLMDEIQARQKERNAQVDDLLEAFKTEREKMAANWQNLVATMARKRGGKPVMEAKEEVSTVNEFVKKKEKAPETVKMSLDERVLEFINKHPEGIRVGDMEKPLGSTRIKLGQAAKRLLDEGKVRKEENLYFPL